MSGWSAAWWIRQLASGAISANGRGNASVRVPSSDDMHVTTPPSLNGLGADGVAPDRAGRDAGTATA
jgi:hypothetical protein